MTRDEFIAEMVHSVFPPAEWLRILLVPEDLHAELLDYINGEVAADGGDALDVTAGRRGVQWYTIEDALSLWRYAREADGRGTDGAEVALHVAGLLKQHRLRLMERAMAEAVERGEDPFAQVFRREVLQ